MTTNARVRAVQEALENEDLDAAVCTLPAYVLLVSGYWPVVGTSAAIITRTGRVGLIVPEDELELTSTAWADLVQPYKPSSLDRVTTVAQAIVSPMRDVAAKLAIERGRIACDPGPASEPASYAAMHLFGSSIRDVLHEALPHAWLQSGHKMLSQLASIKTPEEIARLRRACAIAENAFVSEARTMRAGETEAELAARIRAPLSTAMSQFGAQRADGFVFCMSGPNSAKAHGAYAQSRTRELEDGDLVLVHCNSYADGYWTDITRTYTLGENARGAKIREAVFAAREAAFAELRPGVSTHDVDHAAREVLAERGYGKEFKHSTGHGVGFAAISANAIPRLHPASNETLAAGMVCNIEPAVYIEGFGGLRHCDMVAITETGFKLLTPFHACAEDLVLRAEPRQRFGT